ncbi:MAG: cytochrome c3 family protein [Deltaproteobacteria bacterium]|nr:cytochrome c3 family protein [Deltaproteobacteria bacterium]
MTRRTATKLGLAAVIVAILGLSGYAARSHLINAMMPAGSRPGAISFPASTPTPAGFDAAAAKLSADFPGQAFPHVERFKKAGIQAYEGPRTCLGCHPEVKYKDAATGADRSEDLMQNLTTSVHYRFFSRKHPNVWGFNGALADDFPMGMIDRPCPKPGSFAFTAWAETVQTKDGRTLSEGCGQCHIGGQYQAPLGELMPGYETLGTEKDAIDCLICHSAGYDMNRKQVVRDGNGYARWDQDRSLKAAMSVGKTTAQTCLRCHQHNLGGDIYVDEADPSFMQSARNTGKDRPRVMHPGSKRGTPFSPSWDVHAAMGMACTDCHATEGHRIAKGMNTTTMMANDLPGVEVSCEKCHTSSPHKANALLATDLNRHTAKVACLTCHIPSIGPDNMTMRDFSRPTFEKDAGIYIYSDTVKETAPGKGIAYAWWNGDGSFLGNPIGDNPNNAGLYSFYKLQHPWPEFASFDYKGWYEKTMRPIAKRKPSKLYPFKLYNGRQHIDLGNAGPFGGMFVPYNLPVYYATGNPGKAGQAELAKPMMKMMYGLMFKYDLLDRFISYMDVGEWNTGAYEDALALRHVEPRWIPTDALLEVSHSVRKDGALSCGSCHGPAGVIDWKGLGYTDDQAKRLAAVDYSSKVALPAPPAPPAEPAQ